MESVLKTYFVCWRRCTTTLSPFPNDWKLKRWSFRANNGLVTNKETVFKRGWVSHQWLLLNPPLPLPIPCHGTGGLSIFENIKKWAKRTPRWIPDRPKQCLCGFQKLSVFTPGAPLSHPEDSPWLPTNIQKMIQQWQTNIPMSTNKCSKQKANMENICTNTF